MCQLLAMAGADVSGYALVPPTHLALFKLCKLDEIVHCVSGDVMNYSSFDCAICVVRPEIAIHIAVLPLIRKFKTTLWRPMRQLLWGL